MSVTHFNLCPNLEKKRKADRETWEKNPISMKVDNTCLQKRLKFAVHSLYFAENAIYIESKKRTTCTGRRDEGRQNGEIYLFSLKISTQRPLRSWLVIPRINTQYYLIFYVVFQDYTRKWENVSMDVGMRM